MTNAVIHQQAAEAARSIVEVPLQVHQQAVDVIRSISLEPSAQLHQQAVDVIRKIIPPPVVTFFIAT